MSSFEDSTPQREIDQMQSSIHKNSTIPEQIEEDYTTMPQGVPTEADLIKHQ